MGAFLSNIQVFIGKHDSAKLMAELVLAIRGGLDGGLYEETDDAESADRSLILQVSSDRWISVYDQKLNDQNIDDLDSIGKSISRAGVCAVGSLLHDSDLLVMRLYQNGRSTDTIINDLELFNEMSDGSRPRKRNGLPSKWSEVCATGVNPMELKEIWKKEIIFADDALALAAKLLAIPDNAIFRGYDVDPEYQQEAAIDGQVKVLYFRRIIRLSDYVVQHDGPKLVFTSLNAYIAGDVGSLNKVGFLLRNEGQAFTGLDVLLWGPALDEHYIKPGPGSWFCSTSQNHLRKEWVENPQSLEMQVEGKVINGYHYRFPEIGFPAGWLQGIFPGEAAKLGLLKEWMAQAYNILPSFQLTLTGNRVGNSTLFIGFVPSEDPEGQLDLKIPIFIGVEPDKEFIHGKF